MQSRRTYAAAGAVDTGGDGLPYFDEIYEHIWSNCDDCSTEMELLDEHYPDFLSDSMKVINYSADVESFNENVACMICTASMY